MPDDDRTAFFEWLNAGVNAGWVTVPWCIEHGEDPPPSPAELADPDLAFEDTGDHVYAVRILVEGDPS